MEHIADIEPAATPIVCTLSTDAAVERTIEWAEVQRSATAIVPIVGGVHITLPATMVDEIADLARRESSCCAFLTLNTSVIDDAVTLEVTSTNPDAVPVIEAIAGVSLT